VKGIDRDTVWDQGEAVDSIDSTETISHLFCDCDRKHTSPKGYPVHQSPGPIYFPFGKVVNGVYHRRYSAAQHIRESIAQSISMGVYHLRPKMFHGAGNPRNHEWVEASPLGHVPYRYSVLRESFLYVRAQRAAQTYRPHVELLAIRGS
jgi:hypothetical protein